jgi:microcystin-dependent protein
MPFFRWSRVAATNGNADPACPFPEGQAPSSLNDGTRGMMAALKAWGDDIAGAIVTSGAATAYTLSSYSGFDTLPNMSGAMIAFSPHVTNGAGPVTLNVDGLGAKPLRPSPSIELQSNVLIVGTPYIALYNNSDEAWYLHGMGSNAYGVPLFGGMDYWDTVTPSSAFIFPLGQALSRTAYPGAFARWGTTYGAGDGTTTFNVPDKGERVSVMKVGTASRLTSTYFGGNSTLLGATGGGESHALITAEVPALSFSGTTGTDSPDHTHALPPVMQSSGVTAAGSGGPAFIGANNSALSTGGASARHAHGFSGSTSGGGGAHAIVQPTIVCGYILRVI